MLCRDHDYHNFLFSMKASNPLVMVQAYRLLSEEMYLKNWDYPLHLGVTEVSIISSGVQSTSCSLPMFSMLRIRFNAAHFSLQGHSALCHGLLSPGLNKMRGQNKMALFFFGTMLLRVRVAASTLTSVRAHCLRIPVRVSDQDSWCRAKLVQELLMHSSIAI